MGIVVLLQLLFVTLSITSEVLLLFSAVQSLHDYIEMQGHYHKGPLFCLASKILVTRLVFDRHLHCALSFGQLDSKMYKGHSLGIGAAARAAENNVYDAQIRGMGR